MAKKLFFCLVSISIVLVFVGVGFSAGNGNSRKGKFLYRKNCRTCHQDGASATPLSPDTKTRAQWTRAFTPEKYKELSCAAEWEKRSEKDLLDIFSYMYKYAADSPAPAKCK